MLPILARAVTGQPTAFPQGAAPLAAQTASAQGVAALLNLYVQQGSVSGLPAVDTGRLQQHARQQAVTDLLATRATQHLLEQLAGAGLDILLLKGTPIAHLHYPATHLRWRCDTDLYIRAADTERAAETLRENGYTLFGHDRRPASSRQFVATARPNPSTALHFDIHWKLSNRVLFADTLPFDECRENRQPVPALGENAWAPSDTDLLLHACIHRIAHGRGIERNRLIWLYDIHLLWNALDDAEKDAFVQKALAKKIGAVCADALEVCAELFHMDCRNGWHRDPDRAENTPNDWLTLLRRNRRREPTARLIDAGKPRWAWADLIATPGIAQKLAFAKELVLKK